MAQFGISYNTWRKVKSGQAIRRSVAERLEHRIVGAAPAALGTAPTHTH